MAEGGDFVIKKRNECFLKKFRPTPKHLWNKQSIYLIPPEMRDLNTQSYQPRVVSIGPYYNGKPQLQAMEEHKHRALEHFLTRISHNENIQSLQDLVSYFRDDDMFIEKVRNCYTKPIDPEWCDEDDTFTYLMILDGCFVLELLLGVSDRNVCCSSSPPASDCCYDTNDPIFGSRAERHGVVTYVKLDMLLLENQIPLLILEKLIQIANLKKKAKPNILICKFYGCEHHQVRPDEPLGLHVLDVYRKARLSCGDYTGWTVPYSANELDEHGIRLHGTYHGCCLGDWFANIGGFKEVIFKPEGKKGILCQFYDMFIEPFLRLRPESNDQASASPERAGAYNYMLKKLLKGFSMIDDIIFSPVVYSLAWWFFPLWVNHGDINLPFLTINESTKPILLNLLAFERLHLGRECRDMVVTHYVILMSSLIRSEKDVEYLRNNYIISSLPGRSDEVIVKLFSDMTQNLVVDDITGVGVVNEQVVKLCYRRPNMLRAKWLRHFGSDLQVWINIMLAGYGAAFGFINTYINVMNYTATRRN